MSLLFLVLPFAAFAQTPTPTPLWDITGEDAKAYNERGLAYDKAGDYQRAIADYSKAMELGPKLAAAYNSQGTAHLILGDYERALADYETALKLSPDASWRWSLELIISTLKSEQ